MSNLSLFEKIAAALTVLGVSIYIFITHEMRIGHEYRWPIFKVSIFLINPLVSLGPIFFSDGIATAFSYKSSVSTSENQVRILGWFIIFFPLYFKMIESSLLN